MKLAYFSPLNPQPSGISDYSEELLPALAAHAEITLFVDGFEPENQEIRKRFRWFDYQNNPSSLLTLREHDAIVYHMGNDHRYHAGMFDVMRTHPGIVVFHDFALQDFFLGLARDRSDLNLYLDELAACHGETERTRAHEAFVRGDVPTYVAAPLSFPLNTRLAKTARGIITHSNWGRERFLKITDVPVAHVPMPTRVPTVGDVPVQRDVFNIATFGLITPGKGIEQTLRVLARLRDTFDFRYTLVGAENSFFDVRSLIKKDGMMDRVSITGHVSLDEFERRMSETDIAVNIRERTVGETSASLCRIMAAGVPAIVSNVGAFAELPNDAVIKLDPGEMSDDLLLAYFRKLFEDARLRARIAANARQYIIKEHSIERGAERYSKFIEEVISRPEVSRESAELTSSESYELRLVEASFEDAEKLKLAYFSPLNPQQSGISDYSEELLPYLAQHFNIDLFVDGFAPTNPSLRSTFKCFDYKTDRSVLDRLKDYDGVLYHLGNDHRFHEGIVETLKLHPGIVVFHDFSLQDYFLGLAQQRRNPELFLSELGACHGDREVITARELIVRGSSPPQRTRPLDFPLNCNLARAAEGIIVHSEWTRAQFKRIVPTTPIIKINHHITTSAASFLRNAESNKDEVAIACFGAVTEDKGVPRILRVLAELRSEFSFHCTFVGATESFAEVQELVQHYHLADRATLTGHVPLAQFEKLIATTDVAINLRERSVGATSGSLCRIMAAGVPAIISNVPPFTELPSDAVVKIDMNESADALLLEYLRELLQKPSLRARIGENARRHMMAEHNIEDSASSYQAFIRYVVAQRPRKQFIDRVAVELSSLGVNGDNELPFRSVAEEVALLAPPGFVNAAADHSRGKPLASNAAVPTNGNSDSRSSESASASPGRLPKIAGIDYKRAALEYPQKLDAERNYYLRTKPFYNLANKPDKHLGYGMDAETHRHFTDFANMASVLALPAGARILDVGCGSGWLSEYFARLGYDVTGIDISDELIAMARERVSRVPYDIDHETPMRCRFLTVDIEREPLDEKFDAVICYDSLHHFEDEQSVFRHLAEMLSAGGLLFILEGHKPSSGSATETELQGVMQQYGTLESPFSSEYLRQLISDNGLVVTGDYLSVNGLFERELIEADRLPLRGLATDYHYLTCVKVSETASSVPDSRTPGMLLAQFTIKDFGPRQLGPGATSSVSVEIKNIGDTLWLTGQNLRRGIVMPAIRILDRQGVVIREVHGHPLLPRPVVPGQSVGLTIPFTAPEEAGQYTLKIDLVDQQVCWFEDCGSEPVVIEFEVVPI